MPYFVNCPDEEIAIDVERGSNVAKVNLTLVAKDCQGQQLHVTLSEDRFQAGLGDENYHLLSASSAFDGRGNFAECLFRIRVRDTEPPKFITCPMDVVEAANMPASWPLPVARDNVGLKTAPTSVRHPGQMLPPGEYMIDYWAEDYEGNIASCSFVVTVMSSHHETHPGEHNHSHPHPHPHPHDNHHHQPHTSASRQPESPNNALKVGVGIAVVALVGLLIVFGYFFYRRFRRMSNAAQGGGLGASTVRMSSVVGGGGGGGLGGWGIGGGAGTMESLPPRYGMSPEEIMSPPGYDMMATGGGGGVPPEAGELPAKSPLPQ
ncbi:uncharacterized protein LOC143283007 [Babylonia areolata]|uniref:uncharacterized protein LOC143283007 n=1 Tax=Babylonia areolata TaxID=304850 RepID=UPI003FD0293E